jgi:uncharacterized protein (TIGR00299 family) protein
LSRITIIDSQTAGISGDMLLGALIDIGADFARIQETLQLIPTHYPRCKSLRVEASEVRKHGFRTRSVSFSISETDKETPAQEMLDATARVAKASKLTERGKAFAIGSINSLVEVESKLHGVELSRTHLHEAGSADTLADVFGVAAACDSLRIFDGEILGTPVAVGGGSVSFSHGKLATPAPAVLELALQYGIPIVGGPEAVELATPTGVCMLSNLARKFVESYPAMIPEKVGYGAGTKNFDRTPNILRVVVGHSIGQGLAPEIIQVLETSLDDLPGEVLGHALQRILDSGAKDAWITPALFKKGRPGHVLHVICDLVDSSKVAEVMIRETGTLGVRFQQWNRYALERTIETLKLEIAGRSFDVRVKFARDSSGNVVRTKPEFDDVCSIAEALSMSTREVSEEILQTLTQTRAGKTEKS